MTLGKVKWFNESKGGQEVEFERTMGQKGPQASKVTPK